jgi:hemerythrin
MSFAWTPDLAIGVDPIDVQHRELFLRVNSLLEAVGGQRQEREVLEALAFLGSYVVTHLEDEERLMRETGYPGLSDQLVEHGHFINAFGRLRTKFARHGIDAVLAKDVEGELCNWLVRHLQGTDRAFGDWLNGRARQDAAGR